MSDSEVFDEAEVWSVEDKVACIATVFGVDITPDDPQFDELATEVNDVLSNPLTLQEVRDDLHNELRIAKKNDDQEAVATLRKRIKALLQ